MAAQGIFVPQPEVGQNSCFVLRDSVTVDEISAPATHKRKRPTNEGAELRPIHLDG